VSEDRPEVAPVEVDARPVIAAGTGLWLLALLLLGTVFHSALARHHATWWLWACGIGAVLGAYGYYYVSRHVPRSPAAPSSNAEGSETQVTDPE
jgi:hypothetical protein